MFTTTVIAFREFLEAFLIVGVFLGVSRRLELKKEGEICLAAGIGIFLSVLFTYLTYLLGDYARGVLTERNADILESYLLIFSGLFIAYIVFSLHDMLNRSRGIKLNRIQKKLSENTFDISLFATIVFLVAREGFEIALFTASTSLFSSFTHNLEGLMFGFIAASLVGILTFLAYIRFPIGKIFIATEYMIIFLGASLVQIGITKLFETHLGIYLSSMGNLHLQFLPNENSLVGPLLQGFLGIDSRFSLMRLLLMLIYFGIIYFLFLYKRKKLTKIS